MPAATPAVVAETTSVSFSFEEILAASVPDEGAEPEHDDDASGAVPMPIPVFPWRAPLDPLSTSAEAERSSLGSPAWSVPLPSAASTPTVREPNSATDLWNAGSGSRVAEQDGADATQYRGLTLGQSEASGFVVDQAAGGTADQTLENAIARSQGPTLRQPEALFVVDQAAGESADQSGRETRHADSLTGAPAQVEAAPLQDRRPTLPAPEAARRDQVQGIKATADQIVADVADAGPSRRATEQVVAVPPPYGGPTLPQREAPRLAPDQAGVASADRNATDARPAEDETPKPHASGRSETAVRTSVRAVVDFWRPEVAAPDRGRTDDLSPGALEPQTGGNAEAPVRSIHWQDSEAQAVVARHEAVRRPMESTDKLTAAQTGSEQVASDTTRSFVAATPNPIPEQPPTFANQGSSAGPPAPRGPDHSVNTGTAPDRQAMAPVETAIAGSIRPVPVPAAEPDQPVGSGGWPSLFEKTGPDEYADAEGATAELPPTHRDAPAAAAPPIRFAPPDSKADTRIEPTSPALPPTIDPPQTPRVEKISVAVGGGEGQPRAEILLQHKPDGAIQMAVRTADIRLAESLRSGLPDLNSDLESRGFRSELRADSARENAGDSQGQQHRRPRWFYERNDDD